MDSNNADETHIASQTTSVDGYSDFVLHSKVGTDATPSTSFEPLPDAQYAGFPEACIEDDIEVAEKILEESSQAAYTSQPLINAEVVESAQAKKEAELSHINQRMKSLW